MFYPGARVVAHGLKSRSDLNDSCGIVVSRRQRGRWAVQFGCNDQALSVAGKNLALSSTQAEKSSCVSLASCEFGAVVSAESVSVHIPAGQVRGLYVSR